MLHYVRATRDPFSTPPDHVKRHEGKFAQDGPFGPALYNRAMGRVKYGYVRQANRTRSRVPGSKTEGMRFHPETL